MIRSGYSETSSSRPNAMKRQLITLLLVTLCNFSALAKPSVTDLAGKWNAVIEFGKFKFKLNMRVVTEDNGKRVKGTLDIPDQGAKDIPVNAMLFNYPDV